MRAGIVTEKRDVRYRKFALLILIAVGVHLAVLITMNLYNGREYSSALLHPEIIDIDTVVKPEAERERQVTAVNPTMYETSAGETGKPILVVPDLGDEEESFIRIISSQGEEVTIIIEDTHAPFTVTSHGVEIGQNIAKNTPGYVPNRAYAAYTFTHDDYVYEEGRYVLDLTIAQHYRTKGMQANSFFLIGSPVTISHYLQQRLMTASVIFGGYVLLLVAGIILFIRFRSGYILVTICMSLVTTMRFILLGEYPVFAFLQLYDSRLLFLADYFLAVMIFLLTQLLAVVLFRFRISRIIIAVYSVCFLSLEMFGIIRGHLAITFIMHLLGILVTLFVASSSESEYRRYSFLIIVTYTIFSASVTHQILLYQGLSVRGSSIEMMFTNQFSALLYIGSILYAVITTNFRRLRLLEQKQREFERSVLLRGISHDLKLPISVIKLKTQMRGRYELSPEESREYDEVILQAARELEEMSEDINAYMHAVSDTDETGECYILEQLKLIASRYEHFGNDKGVQFQVFLDETECLIPTGALKFERMVCNLIDNAFKYSRDPGTVTLRYTCGKQIRIAVEDTGIGMEKDMIDLVMKPFFRVDRSRSSKGTGLGLSVVKAVVENLNAEIEIESFPDKGTQIAVIIPRHKISH